MKERRVDTQAEKEDDVTTISRVMTPVSQSVIERMSAISAEKVRIHYILITAPISLILIINATLLSISTYSKYKYMFQL